MTEPAMEMFKSALDRIEKKQDQTLEKVGVMTERLAKLEERVPPESISHLNTEISALKIAHTELKTKIIPIQAGIAALASVILSWFLGSFHRGG